MALTLQNLRDAIHHVLRSSRMSTEYPGTDADDVEALVINQAGRWFVSHHPWTFMIRPPTSLSFVQDQAFINLDSDFGQMIGYQMTDGLNYGITFTTPQELANHRATTVTISQNYYWATIVYASTADPPVPRIELYPTPAAAATDVITIWYRAEWTELSADGDNAQIPVFAEFALLTACRIFAAGLEEAEIAGKTVSERLETFMRGPIYHGCLLQDGMQQSSYGPLTGGAIQLLRPEFTWRSATASPVSDPS